jgi:hypothetical protein
MVGIEAIKGVPVAPVIGTCRQRNDASFNEAETANVSLWERLDFTGEIDDQCRGSLRAFRCGLSAN